MSSRLSGTTLAQNRYDIRVFQEKISKTQQEEIEALKQAFLVSDRRLPVQKAAAEAVNRSVDTIQVGIKDAPEFSADLYGAPSEWATQQNRKFRPDNLLRIWRRFCFDSIIEQALLLHYFRWFLWPNTGREVLCDGTRLIVSTNGAAGCRAVP